MYTTASDVWSFGVVIWEIMSLGGCPYPGVNGADLLRLLQAGYRMEPAPLCPPEVDAIARRCWASAPEERPCFGALAAELKQAEEHSIAALTSVDADEGYTEFSHPSSDSNQKNRMNYASIDFATSVIPKESLMVDVVVEGSKGSGHRASTTSCSTSGYGSGEHFIH